MPNLDDFLNIKPKKEKESDMPVVGGSFACQECDEECESAMYHSKDKKLVWVCSQGHTSRTDFSL